MKLGEWIDKNLGWIFAAVTTGVGGFLAATQTLGATAEKVAKLERFAACAAKHIDRIETGAAEHAACPMEE